MSKSSAIFWAAFGGSVAAGLVTLGAVLAAEWLRWFIDRPLVKASASLGFIVGDNTRTHYLFLAAKNPHTKAVMLITFGLGYRQDEWGILLMMPEPGY